MKISRKQILKKTKSGTVNFTIVVPWQETNIFQLNDAVEDQVEDGYLLSDLTYKPGTVVSDESLVVEVTASTSEYTEENFSN